AVGQGGRHPARANDGGRLAEQRLADEADGDTGRRRLDGGAQAGAAGADDEDGVLVGLDLGHLQNSSGVDTAGRAETDVDVGPADPEEAEPGPLRMVTVEAAHAVV